jgi:hypothetical protein
MRGLGGLCLASAVLLAALAIGSGARAQEEREFCADRPGIGTPACTMAPGRVQVELGLGDWTREKDAEARTDSVELGEALVRVGVTGSMEAQIGWTAFGHVREKDRITGAVTKDSGVGDVTLAIRQNLRNPDGSGFSVAVMPYVTLPGGGTAIGAGDWGAGLLLPMSFDLGSGLSLEVMGEMVEASVLRDEDPAGHATEALAGLSLTWQPSEAVQIDIGLNAGLNRDSPDSEVYLGISRRF